MAGRNRKAGKKRKNSTKRCPKRAPKRKSNSEKPPDNPDSDSDLESVIKSPTDPNEYKTFTLANELKVLLISTCRKGCPLENTPINPETGVYIEVEKFNQKYLKLSPDGKMIKSGYKCKSDSSTQHEPQNKRCKRENQDNKGLGHASLRIAVGAGHFHNPPDFPGLARLYEHCCVQFGSGKYKQSGSIHKYMGDNKAVFSSATIGAFTIYYFILDLGTVGEERFKLGVDMLADAINNPLLPAEDVYGEINVLDSEFSLSETNDYSRLFAFCDSMCPEGHPQRNLTNGNFETLNKPDLLDRMKEWKQRHYVANNTSVVIQAAIPLEDLEQMIRKSFEQFPRSSLPNPSDALVQQHPNHFDKRKFNKLYKVVPVHNIQKFLIRWELPTSFVMNWRTKPLLYLKLYLNNDGEGTLIQLLRCHHWAFSLQACYWPPTAGQATFGATFSLWIIPTDKGLKEFDQVITAIYGYLDMITQDIANEDLFVQMQLESADKFHYADEEARHDQYLIITSPLNLLLVDDPKYVLMTMFMVTEFNAKVLEDAVDLFTPDNMNVVLVSKSFKGLCTEKENWYKTEYCSAKFSPALMKKWKNIKANDYFQPLEGMNRYRVENLISPVPRPQADPTVQMLLETNKARVCYLKFNTTCVGDVPTGNCAISIACPLIRKTPMALVMMRIWHWILRDKLVPLFQAPNHAGIKTTIEQQGIFFQLGISGASQHLTEVTTMVLKMFMRSRRIIGEETFTEYKTLYTSTVNDYNNGSRTYAVDLMKFLQTDKHLLKEQYLKAVNGVTFEDFQRLVRVYKERMYICAMLIGCISEANARALTAYIDLMNYRELPEELPANPEPRGLELPLGERCLRVKNILPMDCTSTVMNYYQFGRLDGHLKSLVEKLAQILSAPSFLKLRVSQHLSYYVEVAFAQTAGVSGLTIAVSPQPHRYSTGYVDEKIDNFLINFRRDFASYDNIFENPSNPNLSLAGVTREEHQLLLQMYDNHLLPNGRNFRKLSVQVQGSRKDGKKCTPCQERGIEDKIAMFSPNSFSFDPPPHLCIEYKIPDDLTDENGYFVTNIETLRDSLSPFNY